MGKRKEKKSNTQDDGAKPGPSTQSAGTQPAAAPQTEKEEIPRKQESEPGPSQQVDMERKGRGRQFVQRDEGKRQIGVEEKLSQQGLDRGDRRQQTLQQKTGIVQDIDPGFQGFQGVGKGGRGKGRGRGGERQHQREASGTYESPVGLPQDRGDYRQQQERTQQEFASSGYPLLGGHPREGGQQPGYQGAGRGQQPGYQGGGRRQQPSYQGVGREQQPGYQGGGRRQQPSYQGVGREQQPGYQGGGRRQQPSYQGVGREQQPGYQGGGREQQPGYQGGGRGQKGTGERRDQRGIQSPRSQGSQQVQALGLQFGFESIPQGSGDHEQGTRQESPSARDVQSSSYQGGGGGQPPSYQGKGRKRGKEQQRERQKQGTLPQPPAENVPQGANRKQAVNVPPPQRGIDPQSESSAVQQIDEKSEYMVPSRLSQMSLGASSTSSESSEARKDIVSKKGPTVSSQVWKVLYKTSQPGTLCRRNQGIIQVQSNHFAVDLNRINLKVAYHYHVDIKQCEEQKKEPSKQVEKKKSTGGSKLRRIKSNVSYGVLEQFLDKHKENNRRRYPSFDGKCNLYASRPLGGSLNAVLFDNEISEEDEYGKRKNYSIEIKFANKLTIDPATVNNARMLTQDALQCINVVFQNAAIKSFTQIGSSYFSQPTNRIIDLGGGMEMYYGFYQSVISGGRPLLNVALRHKAFLKNRKVPDVLCEILQVQQRSRDPLRIESLARLNFEDMKLLNHRLFNIKVEYHVPNFPKVIYRVNGLARSANEEKLEDGRTVTQYFRETKKYDIQYKNLPLLAVGKSDCNIKIPMELCTIKRDQCVKGLLPDVQTSNMIREAATDTKTHRNTIQQRVREVNYNDSPYLHEFGFKVSTEFEETRARVLEAPVLHYKDGDVTPFQGKWNNKSFCNTQKISSWAIISLEYVPQRNIQDLEKSLLEAARQCGMQFETNAKIQIGITTGRQRTVQEADVRDYFKKNPSQITFVIIPDNKAICYSYVKRAAELVTGCVTQCVKARTLNRVNYSTAQNILLKVNSKLGGINHTFRDRPRILTRPCMIIGADVTHPPASGGSKQENTMPSIVSVIASHDPSASKYNLSYSLQEPRLEYIMGLREIVKKQLIFFYTKNNKIKPETIIYLRDGVSDGMFEEVLNIELTAIKQAIKDVSPQGYDPPVTFLVVQKRHHTRLFPKNDRDADDKDRQTARGLMKGNYNVPAGTCVDTNIVDQTMQNYYLVSHASLKGVARPTKYVTLYDDLNLSNDDIQTLTYYLCHMFTRCTRSVSYPAPTYYAHLGALRGKAYIKPAIESSNFNFGNLSAEMNNNKILDKILENYPMFFV